MTAESIPILREELLRARHIREAMRDAGAGFAPDCVARFLRVSYMEPAEESAPEVATLLDGLAEIARKRLHDAGIELPREDAGPPSKLSKREREHSANLSMLLAARSIALQVCGNDAEALRVGHEALAWSVLAGDHAQQAVAWCAIGTAHDRAGRFAEHEHAVLREVEAARASKSTVRYLEAITRQLSFLVEMHRYGEANQLRTDALALLEAELPKESHHPFYSCLRFCEGRILAAESRFAEAIQCMREAQRCADPELYPVTRSLIMSQLGTIYLNLSQYRQCIECQHEVVRLADALGSDIVRSWGYQRLAEAHAALKEYDRAADLLATAEACAPPLLLELRLMMACRRAELLIEVGKLDDAAALGRWIIETVGERPIASRTIHAYLVLGTVEDLCGHLERAEQHYRQAVGMAEGALAGKAWRAKTLLAEVLTKLERHDDAAEVLAGFTTGVGIKPEHQARACRLMATIAEARGDIRAVLEYEREGFAIERELLENRAEHSLRNARVAAQTDMLEREAELERERRRRLERELADAVVALGDRKRLVRTVEERLRAALARGGATEQTATTALREALASLRADAVPRETPLHYLAGVEEDFYQRLRLRFPGLTRKQERLCGLLRSGLDSKEIAVLMELGPDGVKAQRKRLRKRLGLEQEESLESVMAGI